MDNLDVEGMKNKEIVETTAVAETTSKRRVKTIPNTSEEEDVIDLKLII